MPPTARPPRFSRRLDETDRPVSSRPARSIIDQPMDRPQDMEDQAAPFPARTSLIALLRHEDGQWSTLWSGQAAALGREMRAAELVQQPAKIVGLLHL